MTAFTDILSASLAVGKKFTSSIAIAFRDNPVAIAEGDLDAPAVAAGWHPYDKVLNGDTNTGEVYSFAADGAVASFESPNFSDRYEYRFLIDALGASAIADLTIELYRATSAAYAGSALLIVTAASELYTGRVEVLVPRKTLRAHSLRGEIAQDATNATGSLPQVNFLVNHTTAQKIGKVRFAVTAGTMNAGAVYMYRRLID
jgi:hypothetical protein